MTTSYKHRGLAIALLYTSRKDRRSHPDGRTDSGGRWFPSDIEDADGDGTCTRSPSRSWPWSYMTRCRTRAHCLVLVDRALAGVPVPSDVAAALRAAVEQQQQEVAA